MFLGGSKLLWKPGHTTNGIVHHQEIGEIEIKTAGEYFLTSQLKFKGEHNGHGTSTNLRHFVFHFLSKTLEERVVLEDLRPSCVNESMFEFTSIVGAAVRFEENDRIFVTTTHPHSIGKEDENCVLSLHHSH